MASPTVYIETTIVECLAAPPSRDLVFAAHQQITRQWWDLDRPRFRLVTSRSVLDGSHGEATLAAARSELLRDISVVETTAEAERFASRLLSRGVLPATATAEALQIALAAVHGVEYLLTWDCRHIANASRRRALEAFCRDEAYPVPVFCTPDQLTPADVTEGRWVDPIVEEVRRIRQEYAARFNYDLETIFDDVQKHQEDSRKAGAIIISAPLRPATRHPDGSSAEPAA